MGTTASWLSWGGVQWFETAPGDETHTVRTHGLHHLTDVTSLSSSPNTHATGTGRNASESRGHIPPQIDKEGMFLPGTVEPCHRRNLGLCTVFPECLLCI